MENNKKWKESKKKFFLLEVQKAVRNKNFLEKKRNTS